MGLNFRAALSPVTVPGENPLTLVSSVLSTELFGICSVAHVAKSLTCLPYLSKFGMAECFITGLSDEYPKYLRKYKWLFVTVACASSFLLALPMCAQVRLGPVLIGFIVTSILLHCKVCSLKYKYSKPSGKCEVSRVRHDIRC